MRATLRHTAALAAAGALAGCLRAPTPPYVLERAQIGDVRDVAPATGVIRPRTQVEMRPPAEGVVLELLAAPNDVVAAGQPLARLALPERDSAAAAADADRMAAAAGLEEALARADQARRALGNRRFMAERGFISASGLSSTEDELRGAEAAVERARAALARAAAVQAGAVRAASETLVRAPFAGVVLSRAASVGQRVRPTDEAPLFTVASAGPPILEALVAEADMGRVAPNVRVAFTVEAYPGRTFTGRIERILRSPRQVRNFVSYPVEIAVDAGDDRLLPGMTAAVEFIHQDARSVLRAPVKSIYFKPKDYDPVLPPRLAQRLEQKGIRTPSARAAAEMGVLFAANKQRLFVLENGKPVSRGVRVGAETADFVEVVEGLKPGELVVLAETEPQRRRSALL